MYLVSHRAVSFRNISELELSFQNGVNVVSGSNGQGKTNLLESVFLLSGARSFRAGKDEDLIKKGGGLPAVAEATVFRGGREQTLKLTVSEEGRRISLNKGEPKRASAHLGVFFCSVFSPEHLSLVKGAPALRRRFLDTALAQLSPKYAENLKKYARLIKQKSNLLKDCARVPAAYDMLDVFDLQLASCATVIYKLRSEFCGDLMKRARDRYADVSNKAESFSLEYVSTLFPDADADEERALHAIRECRASDVRNGCCQIGPHRDDVAIYIAGDDARVFASQGQQRTAVLALKLAEAEVMEYRMGEAPVLLLDDVLSELDDDRKRLLLESVKEKQAIITACDADYIASRTDARVFHIRNGALY